MENNPAVGKIYYSKPSITEKEVKYVEDSVRAISGEKRYEYIDKFEAKFREYLGSKFSIATSNCTGAIILALATIGLKPNDEVILADINWIASAAPITYFGAKPIFIDILPDSWCIDPKKIEKAITPKTRAIIATHLYGNLAEMDKIMEIARGHNLIVIEDAAEALGSEYKGKKAGSIGDFGVFSFHATKMCTCGEGGMLVTNNEEFSKKARILSDHGRNPEIKKLLFPDRIGYKHKMSNMQAALGLAQLERINELLDRKIKIFQEYKRHLSGLPVEMNPQPEYTKNSFWMPTAVFNKSLDIHSDELISLFQENNIDARPFFYPLSSLPMFKARKENTVSYDISSHAINLPSYHDLTDEQIKYVCDLLKNFLKKKENRIS
ncbi:MAG: DegT/DnrJ/EryC1/StrS family aminotransferase [Candidatus Nanoarchaeia archaeon]|nr:DegT/DnrJ/EryC1/StrS family aminotransferase [Candidatus Nanoarchaeia archaeon]